MMLGCHETRAELGLGTGQRGFAGGIFDEVRALRMSFLYSFLSSICCKVAFWDRRIGDDEIHMFLGGYSEIQNPIK